MAMLIRVFVDGRLVGMCNKECYKSKSSTCSCCCGGANHGVGRRQARYNTRHLPLSNIAAWAEEHFRVLHSLVIHTGPPRARLMPCDDHESGPHGLQEPV